jgi:hypothetical protein
MPNETLHCQRRSLLGLVTFSETYPEAFKAITGRQPSTFETATATALENAYQQMSKVAGPVPSFTALSAATGAGKSTGACVLMAYLHRHHRLTSAYVVPTIALAEEVFSNLSKLIPSEVVVFTSLHKANVSPRALREYALEGQKPSAQFTEVQFRSARVVICTHERWSHELATGQDGGVLRRAGVDRDLILVDEEPSLELTVVRQPEHVSMLASLLADTPSANDAVSYGFTSAHPASAALLAIHDRMFTIKAIANGIGTDGSLSGASIRPAELVTTEEAHQLAGLTDYDIATRIAKARLPDPADALEFHGGTVEFLKLAAQGRVFYSRGDGAAFYAYGYAVQPRGRHLILDGTADLNGLYAVGNHVSIVEAPPANYENVKLYNVVPPKQLKGKMRASGTLKNRTAAMEYMEWFIPFLLERSQPGQTVLVSAKKALLNLEAHKAPQFDDSHDNGDRNLSIKDGRTIRWCNFGRGRGLNEWKACSAYFRLGDFWMKRAALMTQVANFTGQTYTAADLRSFNSGVAKVDCFEAVQDAHLAVTNKQDAARICIRHLDDDGRAMAADLYMVDCDMAVLQKERRRMFPGAGDYETIAGDLKDAIESTSGDTAADRVADFMLTTGLHQVEARDLCAVYGVRPSHYARTMQTRIVQRAIAARGWTETTRRALGLYGKGKLLVRHKATATRAPATSALHLVASF